MAKSGRKAAETVSTKIGQTIDSVSSVLGDVFLSPSITSDDEDVEEEGESSAPAVVHPLAKALETPIEGVDERIGEDYKAWADKFDVESHTDDITSAIETDSALKALHESLVPVKIPFTDFWKRYYWEKHVEEALAQRRAALLKKFAKEGNDTEEEKKSSEGTDEKKSSGETTTKANDDEDDEEAMGWGDDDDDA